MKERKLFAILIVPVLSRRIKTYQARPKSLWFMVKNGEQGRDNGSNADSNCENEVEQIEPTHVARSHILGNRNTNNPQCDSNLVICQYIISN